MTKNFFTQFASWQYAAHIFLIALLLSGVAWFLKAPIDLKMLAIIFGVIFLGDFFSHVLFWNLPKGKGRWRD